MNPFHFDTRAATGSPTQTQTQKPPVYDTTSKSHQAIERQLLTVALRNQARQHSAPVPASGDPLPPPDDTPMNLHREIMIVQNFLSPEICQEYIEYIKSQPAEDLSVFDADKTNESGDIAWQVDKDTRDTQTVGIEPIKSVIFDLMRHAVRDYLNPYFNVTIKDSELPQILIYHPGGHYRPHIDGEALFHDGSGVLSWKRSVERDISLIIYLNDDFEGGDLVFPKQAITVKPRPGLMLAFPSNHHFLHGVNPVTKGTRYAIVAWFSLGTPAM